MGITVITAVAELRRMHVAGSVNGRSTADNHSRGIARWAPNGGGNGSNPKIAIDCTRRETVVLGNHPRAVVWAV
jgi:hypothetical protein